MLMSNKKRIKPNNFQRFAVVVDSGKGQSISLEFIAITGIDLGDDPGIVQVIFSKSCIISLAFSQSFIHILSQLHSRGFSEILRFFSEEMFWKIIGSVVRLLLEMSRDNSLELQQVNMSKTLEMLSKLFALMSNFVR